MRTIVNTACDSAAGRVRRWVIRFLLLALLASAHSLAVLAQPVAQSSSPLANKRVLLLYSYGHGSKFIAIFDDSLLSVLEESGVKASNLYYEYLDLERYRGDSSYRARLSSNLDAKYAGQNFDLIITAQQPALDYLLREGRSIAPGAPVITLQAPMPSEEDAAAAGRRFFSRVTRFDFKGTLEHALALFPQTRHVLFVSGVSNADKAAAEAAAKAAAAWRDKIEFEFSANSTLAQLLERVARLPPHSIVVFTQYNRDSSGRVLLSYEAERMIVRAANAPVFGVYDINLAVGGIGGSAISVERLGKTTGKLALDILSGRRESNQRVTRVPEEPIAMFDWEQIRRWGGKADSLPADTVFVNRQTSLWERFRYYLIGTGVFLLIQSWIILVLVLNRHRRATSERLLREREAHFRILVEQVADAIIVTDADGLIVQWNLAAERMFGMTVDEACGQPASAVMPQAPLDARRSALAQAAEDETRLVEPSIQIKARRRDGTEFPAELSLSSWVSSGRRYFVSVVRDVWERVESERILRDAEERYRLLFESAPDGIAIVHGQTIETANGAFLRLLGVERLDEVVGKRFVDFLDPSVRAAAFERGNHLAGEVQQASAVERRLLRADGSKIEAEVSAASYRQGERILTQVIVRDVTERKRAEELRQEGEKRYRLLFDINPNPMWVYDVDNLAFLAVNQAAIEHYGYTRDEFMAMTFADMRPSEEMARFRRRMQELVAEKNGGLQYSGRWRHRKKGGELIDVEVVSHPLSFAGRPARLALMRDVTEQMRFEERRRQLDEQLRESQKMEAIGTLAGGIAHDFNNILAAILGNAVLAKKDLAADSRALVSLAEIEKAAGRAKNLVQQILAFSRRQSQDMVIHPLGPLVQEVVSLLRATLPPRVELATELTDAPLFVLADATQIHQVLMNLCTNAWHALEERTGRILIGLDAVDVQGGGAQPEGLAHGSYARIRVSDNGCGIDEATLARIFEPFFTTKSVGKGTGLGLAVVHGIVKSHHGAITVQSTPGKGTCVEVYLPIAASVAEIERPVPRAQAAAAVRGKRVLYVDDDEAMVFLVRRLLEDSGYRVSAYQNPQEAIEAVRESPAAFDLIVTDFNMPGLSGLDVARELQGIRPGLPVVITSGYLTDDLVAAAHAAGVREVVYKPNTVDDLCRTIEQLLQARV